MPAEHGGDPSRVVLAGHSSGAYNAVMLGLDPARFGRPELAGRIKGIVGLSGPYDFYPFDVKESIDAFSGVPDPERTQPINLVTPAAPPMLLVHGVRDTLVGDYHTVRLSAKLSERRRAGGRAALSRPPRIAETVLGLARPLRRLWPVYATWRRSCAPALAAGGPAG